MPLSQEKEDDRAGTTAAWMQAAEPHEEYDVMIRQLVRVRIVLGGGNRSSKLRVAPDALRLLASVRVIESLAYAR